MTPGQRWRRRRALVIFTVAAAPFSQRVLADVFDLGRGQVQRILAGLEAESGLAVTAATAEARKRWVHDELRKWAVSQQPVGGQRP